MDKWTRTDIQVITTSDKNANLSQTTDSDVPMNRQTDSQQDGPVCRDAGRQSDKEKQSV